MQGSLAAVSTRNSKVISMKARTVLRAAALASMGAAVLALLNHRLVPAVLFAAAGVVMVLWSGKQRRC